MNQWDKFKEAVFAARMTSSPVCGYWIQPFVCVDLPEKRFIIHPNHINLKTGKYDFETVLTFEGKFIPIDNIKEMINQCHIKKQS